MKDLYNIYFTLGDPFADGHGGYSRYHMESNYTIEEIKEAYKKTTSLLGFDFVKECCSNSEEFYIQPKYASILAEKGIIDKEYLNVDEDYYPIGAYSLSEAGRPVDEFVDIFISIVQLILPDFKMEERDLKEEELVLLQCAAYGLTDPTHY